MSELQLKAINVNLLVALDALIRTSSVTLAARNLGVTPSAMSHTLRQLRELLEDPLLVRGQRGMTLTPRAMAIGPALGRALTDLERSVQHAAEFDPSAAVRRFRVAAPDFAGTQLTLAVARSILHTAPGLDLDVVPSERIGNTWRLETGDLDILVGAVVREHPQIRRRNLYPERFLLIANTELELSDEMSLAEFVAIPHALISIDDHYDPETSWVDQTLRREGLSRRVAYRSRYFVSVAEAVARMPILSVVPSTLARWAAERFPLQVREAPLAMPTYFEELLWHQRFDNDPVHAWLRERMVEAATAISERYPVGEAPKLWTGPVSYVD